MPFEVHISDHNTTPVVYLKNSHGGCSAEIYAFGGLLNAFNIPTQKGNINVIDGFSSPENAAADITNGFKSAKLSPFVCRMNKGTYTFLEKEYHVNGFYLGNEAIHGLLYDAPFAIVDTRATDKEAGVVLKYDYNGEDEGYPFPYTMIVDWKLETFLDGTQTNHKITVATTITHNNVTAIPFADGWHPYFTLGNGVDDYILQFDSDEQVEFDAALLPTGRLIVDDRFTNGSLLKGITLDNCFVLNKGKAQPRCILQNDLLRLSIEPDASYPFLQIYTPPHRNSIAIENLSGAPDAFNNDIGLLMLQPGPSMQFSTSYTISEL